MKKWQRIFLIGALHCTVYLWLLPDVILPEFGSNGTRVTVTVLGIVSVVLLSGLLKKKKRS